MFFYKKTVQKQSFCNNVPSKAWDLQCIKGAPNFSLGPCKSLQSGIFLAVSYTKNNSKTTLANAIHSPNQSFGPLTISVDNNIYIDKFLKKVLKGAQTEVRGLQKNGTKNSVLVAISQRRGVNSAITQAKPVTKLGYPVQSKALHNISTSLFTKQSLPPLSLKKDNKYYLLQTVLMGLGPVKQQNAAGAPNFSLELNLQNLKKQSFHNRHKNVNLFLDLQATPTTGDKRELKGGPIFSLGLFNNKVGSRLNKTFLSYWLLPFIGFFTILYKDNMACSDSREYMFAEPLHVESTNLSRKNPQTKVDSMHFFSRNVPTGNGTNTNFEPQLNNYYSHYLGSKPSLGLATKNLTKTVNKFTKVPLTRSYYAATLWGPQTKFEPSNLADVVGLNKGALANSYQKNNISLGPKYLCGPKDSQFALKTADLQVIKVGVEPTIVLTRLNTKQSFILKTAWAGAKQSSAPKNKPTLQTPFSGCRASVPYIKETILNYPMVSNCKISSDVLLAYNYGNIKQTSNTVQTHKYTPVINYKENLLFLEKLTQVFNWNGPKQSLLNSTTLQAQRGKTTANFANILPEVLRNAELQKDYIFGGFEKAKTKDSIFKLFQSYIKKENKPQKTSTKQNKPAILNLKEGAPNFSLGQKPNLVLKKEYKRSFKASFESTFNLLAFNGMCTDITELSMKNANSPSVGVPVNTVQVDSYPVHNRLNSFYTFNNHIADLKTCRDPKLQFGALLKKQTPLTTASFKQTLQEKLEAPIENPQNFAKPFFSTKGVPNFSLEHSKKIALTNYPTKVQSFAQGSLTRPDLGVSLNATNPQNINAQSTHPLTKTILSKTEFWTFRNYLKYLRTQVNKFFKLNKYNTNKIVHNYLPNQSNADYFLYTGAKQNVAQVLTQNGNVEPSQNEGAPNFSLALNQKITLNKPNLYSRKQTEKCKSTAFVQLSNYAQKSIPTVLKHKKFNQFLKSGYNYNSVLMKNVQNGVLDKATESSYKNPYGFLLQKSGAELTMQERSYIERKKDLQKKRKAKKQRLESRRQKKRKRFYPRPTWFRLRLGLSLYKTKKALTPFTRSGPQLLQKDFFVHNSVMDKKLKFTKASFTNLNRLNNYIESAKLSFAPTILLKQNGNCNTILNTYVQTLQARKSATGVGATIKKSNPWQNAMNVTTYNNLVYNLWVTSNKPTAGVDINPPVSKQKTGGTTENFKRAPNFSLGHYYSKIGSYSYENKLLLTRKTLTSFKNNAGYSVVEDKANNPPKKENDSNLLRDYWIWLYNLTNTNTLNKQIVIDNFIKYIPITIQTPKKSTGGQNVSLGQTTSDVGSKQSFAHSAFTKNENLEGGPNFSLGHLTYKSKPLSNNLTRKSFNRLYWSLNKTNLWSSTSKRLNYWSTQKLRNQSKNNKTKYLERQFYKQINALFTNLTFKNLLAVSNNTTGASNFSLGPNNLQVLDANKAKVLKSISQKMHQKEMKLSYLSKNNNWGSAKHSFAHNLYAPEVQSTKLFVNFDRKISNFSKKRNVSKTLNNTQTAFVYNQGFLAKPGAKQSFAPTSNFIWWSNFASNLNTFSPTWQTGSKPFIDQSVKTAKTNLFESQDINFLGFSTLKNVDNLYASNTVWEQVQASASGTAQAFNLNLTCFALLFHFCALISLVSISQIRCFIKFNFILLHKLSNIYLQLIYKNLSLSSKLFGFWLKTPPTSTSQHFLTNLTKASTKNVLLKPQTKVGQIKSKANSKNLLNSKLGRSTGTKTDFFGRFSVMCATQSVKPAALLKSIKSTLLKNGSNQSTLIMRNNKKGYLNYLSFNYNAASATGNNSIKSMRLLLDTKILNGTVVKSRKKQTGFDSMVVGASPMREIASTVQGNALHLRLTQLATLVVRLLVFGLQKQKLPAPNQVGTPSQAKLDTSNAGGVSRGESTLTVNKNQTNLYILTKGLNIYSLEKQLVLNQNTTKALNIIQKETYNAGLQIVDTFEYFLRLIYSFFEKPAELTMDWIAYAFLVEWSSDFLTFTPENKQNWLAFAKIARQNQLLYGTILAINKQFIPNAFIVTAPNSILGVQSTHALQNKNAFLNFANSGLGILFSLTFSQLLYKRVLYMNDLLISILNRPDTDLINRQKKGTLFWDIWSDILIKAADKYNINVPSLSNIKEEQNLLLDKFLSSYETNKEHSKTLNFLKNAEKSNSINLQKKYITGALNYSVGHFNKGNSLLAKATILHENTQRISASENLLMADNVPHFTFSKQGVGAKQSFAPTMDPSSNKMIAAKSESTEFITYQSKETDLFLDYHPPKSFSHISAIQYYSLVQQPIGTVVCQIYAGILNKQIAKNILVIGSGLNSTTSTSSERMQKTLLIQALAGETEIKIITDNANRYAIVNRGFAVGIKLLKEVFEAIALNTPCLFLLEDIHLIGERRPLLISDHGDSAGDGQTGKSTEISFGAQRNGEAVHEKNQVLYQLNRHGITHYKKPFKGDFSLAIPTNHFSFDLFFKSRYSNFAAAPANPLSYGINFDKALNQSSASTSGNDGSQPGSNLSQKLVSQRKKGFFSEHNNLSSALQITQNKLLSPPSTSPFTVLLLKEQKKLQPKKIVKELPWVGLPSEQLALLPRVSYSVRAKVAALADLSFSNMSAKLDMITDLLVIIDSVRGNRGFVVFATTHLPHILDPALRRPGRLDETISIPTISNIWNRWEFTKAAQPVIGFATPELSLTNAKNVFCAPTTYISNSLLGYHGTVNYLDFLNLDFMPNQNTNIISPILTNLVLKNKKRMLAIKGPKNLNGPKVNQLKSNVIAKRKLAGKTINNLLYNSKNIAYYQMGQKYIRNWAITTVAEKSATQNFAPGLKFNWNLLNFSPVLSNVRTYNSTTLLTENREFLLSEIQYKSLYSGTHVIQNTLIGFISGKLSELFAFQNVPIQKNPKTNNHSLNALLVTDRLNKYISLEGSTERTGSSDFQKALNSDSKTTQKPIRLKANPKNRMSLYGIDQTWRAATSLALSFVQKRYLYHQNLIVPKLLNFLDYAALEEPPSPPSSNILIPAKRYENYKKAFKENIERKVTLWNCTNGIMSEIQDKLENHIKQNYIQSIYKASSNNSQISNIRSLASIPQQTNSNPFKQPTNISWYYQNKLFKRHKNYLTNQWWNGQLTEHSAESLFLSDIDWRYTFIYNSTENALDLQKNQKEFFNKLKQQAGGQGNSFFFDGYKDSSTSTRQNNALVQDILLDFPDSPHQYYNPKNRRWMLNAGFWSSWFDIDKKLQTDIINHLIFESFIISYNLLNRNRELLDYSVTKFIQKGLIKEMNIIHILRKMQSN